MVHSHAVRRPLGALSAELVRHVWHRHLTPSLAALAAQALGEGVERSQLLGTLRGAGECAGFGNICWRLKMAVGLLRLRPAGEARTATHRALPARRAPSLSVHC